MKICYLVMKNHEVIEIDVEKMTTIFFAIITVLKSRPESIVNMAMMQSIPTTQVKAITQSMIQMKYPQLLDRYPYKKKEKY